MSRKSNVVAVDFNTGKAESAKERKNRLARENRAAKKKEAEAAKVEAAKVEAKKVADAEALAKQIQLPMPIQSPEQVPATQKPRVATTPREIDRLINEAFKTLRKLKICAVQNAYIDAVATWAGEPGRRQAYIGAVSYSKPAWISAQKSKVLRIDFSSLNPETSIKDVVTSVFYDAGLSYSEDLQRPGCIFVDVE